jgi:hypothetical protein
MGGSQLEIRLSRADDMETVVRFFGRTAYGATRTGPDTILLSLAG